MRIFHFLLILLFCVTACQSEIDKIISRNQPVPALVGALQQFSGKRLLEELKNIEESRPRFWQDPDLRRKFLLLYQAYLRKPGTMEQGSAIFAKYLTKKQVFPGLRRVFRAMGNGDPKELIALINKVGSRDRSALLSELITVLALSPRPEAEAETLRLLEGFSQAPELFLPVFRVLPSLRFEKFADYSRPDIRSLARTRLQEQWAPALLKNPTLQTLRTYVRELRERGTPMLAVVLLDILAEKEIAHLQRDPARRKAIKERLRTMYGLLTALKPLVDKRREGEKMYYAAVVAKLYHKK